MTRPESGQVFYLHRRQCNLLLIFGERKKAIRHFCWIGLTVNDSFTVANRDGSPEKLSPNLGLNKERTERITAASGSFASPSPTPSGDRSGGFAPLDRAGEDIDRADCYITQNAINFSC